ncbi:molecular chaperone DnaJ [candidate division WWE3 bacterium]|nr:molecular chaperone DnaJ [candidate division WWE3 bacterium]
MASQNYYDILGVNQQASEADIKSAYKKLAKKYHPDVNKDPQSQDKFKEISQAYQVLSNAEKKAAYDRLGHQGFEQARQGGYNPYGNAGYNSNFEDIFGGFQDPFDIFEQFFGGSRSSQGTAQPSGEDLEMVYKISFEEAVLGAEKTISYQRQQACETCDGTGSKKKKAGMKTCEQCRGNGRVQVKQSFLGAQFAQVVPCPTCRGKGKIVVDPCPQCRGTGRRNQEEKLTINIPAGVDTGVKMRFKNKGNIGENQSPAGDLYLLFKVEPHKIFTRKDADILLVLPVSIPQLVLGDTIKIPTIYGEHDLTIPAGTQSGNEFKIKGQGTLNLQKSQQKGDQIVTVKVEIPTKLSKKEKELYQQLSESASKPKHIFDTLFG